jgi:hypothetical protein
MSYEHILVDAEEGVGIVTLNRPDKLNAMNRQLSSELHDAADAGGCKSGSQETRRWREEDSNRQSP